MQQSSVPLMTFWYLRIARLLKLWVPRYYIGYSKDENIPTSFVTSNWITPWSKVLFEKLIVTNVIKKFLTFCGAPRFFSLFTRVCHWSLSWAIRIIIVSYIYIVLHTIRLHFYLMYIYNAVDFSACYFIFRFTFNYFHSITYRRVQFLLNVSITSYHVCSRSCKL
jgi:hypothetical protein